MITLLATLVSIITAVVCFVVHETQSATYFMAQAAVLLLLRDKD